jgi:hypothetical protein
MHREDTMKSGFHAGLTNAPVIQWQWPQFTTSTDDDAAVLRSDKPLNLTERLLSDSEKPTLLESIANYTVGLVIVLSHVILLALNGEDAAFVDRTLNDR